MPDESTEERKLRLYAEGAAQFEPDDIWAAEARAQAVVTCGLCDDDGYRCEGTVVCDHVDRSVIAARGIARVRAVLAAAKAKRETT